MDKNILKSFAIEARKELIEKIKVKARQYGIEKDSIKNSNIISSDSIVINGTPLSKDEKLQREKLIKKIEDINENGGDGYNSVIEEVAYTWFNRFTALRFMEVNNYMPTRVRPLSSTTPGSVEPELVKEASNVDLKVDKQKIYEMKFNNDMEALFKYMIIAQCNSLNTILPFMFEKIGHYTELLLPDGLLNEGAFIRKLTDTNIIPENDWEYVEIIGWLYQYYNSEEKDRVIKAKKKYTKDEIPFATQLFTPDWIVRYMVQNSLGRYWVESHTEHNELKKEWEFYLDNPNPEPDFEEKLAPYINKELKVEDIKCFDPACGSGHILVYMFDVLYQIYEKCGYINREIPRLIIENNLYGLDIDDRAYQLACFAVIMKGMKYNNRLLRSIEREGININIASIQETNNINDIDIEYIAGESSGENYNKVKAFIEQFKNAKIYGSLIKVEEFDKKFLEQRCDYILNNPVEHMEYQSSKNKQVDELLKKLIKQADIMINIYDVLVTNPPYMGSNYMNNDLGLFLKKEYSLGKSDTFSAFIIYCINKVRQQGHLGFLTPFVWLYILTYENLRELLLSKTTISTLIQLEYNSFPEACVPVVTFTLRNNLTNISGEYINLDKFPGAETQKIKVLETIDKSVDYRFTKIFKSFVNMPGSEYIFSTTEEISHILSDNKSISEVSECKSGIMTGKDNLFIKNWYEVDKRNIKANCKSNDDMKDYRWFPICTGGEFRKYYGNNDYVVNLYNDGADIKRISKNYRLRDNKYYFKKAITWSRISSSKIAFRVAEEGMVFGDAGPCMFVYDNEDYEVILAFLNSKIANVFLKAINPTMNFQVSDVENIPYKYVSNSDREKIISLVNENIRISKNEWDLFENSFEYRKNAIVLYKEEGYIESAINKLAEKMNNLKQQLKQNEEELNRIFIKIYGLQDEMTPEVEEKDITIRKADREREIKSFISYAVGCILGRYSLDEEGLIHAGGEFDSSKYKIFKADEDNIIPILSDSYFEDDIVAKFVEFVRVTFGEESLSENLDFIAEILGKKNNETVKDTIRRYFLNDFFKDHVQTYKKRPIYWLFTSGKQKAFNCLVYMHRYDKTTLSRIRTDYLHELQDRLDTERKSLTHVIDGDYSNKEKNDAKKKLTTIDKQIDELKKYDEVLHHMADMQIEIDLDDGVAVNYEKFKGLVSKI